MCRLSGEASPKECVCVTCARVYASMHKGATKKIARDLVLVDLARPRRRHRRRLVGSMECRNASAISSEIVIIMTSWRGFMRGQIKSAIFRDTERAPRLECESSSYEVRHFFSDRKAEDPLLRARLT